MKNIFKIGIIYLALFTFMSQTFAMETTANNQTILLSPEQAQEYIKTAKDLYLLDVRTQAEYTEKNLTGSTLIPLAELPNRLNEIPKDKEILIYCRSGNRATQAATIIAPSLAKDAKLFVLNGFPTYN